MPVCVCNGTIKYHTIPFTTLIIVWMEEKANVDIARGIMIVSR